MFLYSLFKFSDSLPILRYPSSVLDFSILLYDSSFIIDIYITQLLNNVRTKIWIFLFFNKNVFILQKYKD